MSHPPLILRAAIDRTRHTEALFEGRARSERVTLDFVTVKPITRAFRRMAREAEFDLCEMALATQAIAHAYGKPIRSLPAPLLREVPHPKLVCLQDAPFHSPADLGGKRIAVRAYSQTTAVWLRGIMQHEYGVDPASVLWLTQEDGHVAELPIHPNEHRLEPEVGLDAVLQSGQADAAITLHLGHHGTIRSVLPQSHEAGLAWQRKHRLQPINHLVAVRSALLDTHPWLGPELVGLFEAARRAGTADGTDPMPWEPKGPALLLRFVHEQGLTPSLASPADLFAALPTQTPARPPAQETLRV